MEEINQLFDQANKIAKELKIKRQEALQLIAVHELASIHFHIDCFVMGMAQAHMVTQKKK